jgi:hypothetical protein
VSEKAKETWDQYRRRTVKWAIRMEFALLHSTVYRKLDYAPALKVLNWFHEKRTIDVDKKRRGAKRYKVLVQDVSFTYAEAALRGLDHKKFNRALRELHVHGFIDVIYLGSGKQRDYSRYALSDRWRTFNTNDFKPIDFPKNISYVARDEVTKQWTGRSSKQVQRPKTAVDQRPKTAVENPAQRPKCAVVDPVFNQSSTADIGRILSTKPCSADVKKGCKKKVLTLNSRFKSMAAASCNKIPFTKPKECQLTKEEIEDFLREVANVRSWT